MTTSDADDLFAIRFRTHEVFAPGLSESCLAAAYGLTEDRYREARSALQQSLDQTVEGLLSDESTQTALQAKELPESIIAFAGDSLTADAVSWANQLAGALHELAPQVTTRNIAVDGDTSVAAVPRVAFRGEEADLLVVMIGTNDGQLYEGLPLVDDDQTTKSLTAIQQLARGFVAWVVPPDLVSDRIHRHRVLADLPMRWSEEVHGRKQAIVAEQSFILSDCRDLVDISRPESTIDGLHLSPESHQLVAKGVALRLADALNERAGRRSP